MKSHTRKWKEAQLTEVKDLLERHPVIAVARLEGFPAALFSQIRKKLSGKAEIRVSKVRVIQRALDASKIKGAGLEDHVSGSIAVIGTSLNPFELYGFLKKNKGRVAAKAGQDAPEDITIPAMDTGLPPGPALSDLKQAGLNVRMQGATISVVEDKLVAKKGEPIKPAVAAVLQKLDIKPVKVGLSLSAVLEGKEVFLPEVLDIDEEQTLANVQRAYTEALNLSVFAGILNSASTPLLVARAYREARAVAIEAGVLEPEVVGDVLAKAERQAQALKAKVKDAPATAPAEEKPADAPAAEEKKEEAPAEKNAEEKKEEAPAAEKKESPDGEKKE